MSVYSKNYIHTKKSVVFSQKNLSTEVLDYIFLSLENIQQQMCGHLTICAVSVSCYSDGMGLYFIYCIILQYLHNCFSCVHKFHVREILFLRLFLSKDTFN